MAATKFCGNPYNHETHGWGEGPPFYVCEGVKRVEVREEIVEKFEPTEMAEDGTAYSEIEILIKDERGTTRVLVQKASRIQLDVVHQPFVSLDVPRPYLANEIESATLTFAPHVEDHHPAFTVERIPNDDAV